MKKVFITFAVFIMVVIAAAGFLYLRYINLDVYSLDINKNIISYKEYQFKDSGIIPDDLKVGKQIGRIEGQSSFRVWEVKGKNREEYIVITGFMFPTILYKNININ